MLKEINEAKIFQEFQKMTKREEAARKKMKLQISALEFDSPRMRDGSPPFHESTNYLTKLAPVLKCKSYARRS